MSVRGNRHFGLGAAWALGAWTLGVSALVTDGFGLGSDAWALELEAPCIPVTAMTSKEELAKLKAKGSHAGQRVCTQVLAEAKKLLQERVKEQADAYYNGCDLNPTKEESVGGCRGAIVPKETCNMLDTPGVPKTFNQMAENKRNHKGASCGDWPFFDARLSGRTCGIRPDYTRTNHYIEDSFNRGAWIQALNCYHQQVQAEVEKGKVKLTTFRVPGPSGGFIEQEGPCVPMAKRLEELMSSEVPKENVNLATSSNLSDIENCTGEEKINSKEINSDVGRLRQSACALKSARTAVEAMFIHVAACEVWLRAGKSYTEFLGTNVTRDQITAQVRAAGNGMRSKDSSRCSHGWILNNFYKPNYLNAFRQKAESIWNAGTCGPQQ